MNEFLFKVAEILDVKDVTPDLRFREIPEWDSLKGFALIVFLERTYGRSLPVTSFQAMSTVGDLARFANLISGTDKSAV